MPRSATIKVPAPPAAKQTVSEGAATERAAPAPLTPEELADRLVPSDARISPDGRHVAFTVAPAGRKGEHPEQAIWLSRDGAPAEPFTSGIAGDEAPRWSPDGSKLLFLSDRAERGTCQIYLISLTGGEARPLGDLKGELSVPDWSPDGTRIAVLCKEPETPEEKKRKEDRDDAVVVDYTPKLNRLWVVDVNTGKAHCLTHGKRRAWSYDWSPDGTRLAVVTTDQPDLNATCEPGDLWTLPATGGLPVHVAHFPSFLSAPTFVETAGGLQIAVRANGHRADPADSVWTVPASGGKPRNLLPGYPGNVDSLADLPGRPGAIAVRMVEGTHANLYACDVAAGSLTILSPEGMHDDGSVLSGPSFSADGSRLALIWSDGTAAPEVYVAKAGDIPTALTKLGESLSGRLAPVEHVRWESDGVEIEGLLTLPMSYEEGVRYPLIIEIHGGPSWQWEDYAFVDWHDWAQLMASHGYAVLAPNPRGSTGRGSTFQQLLQDDVGGGEVRDLITGTRAMVARGIADPDRLGIGGWSWGGYLTAMTITQTDIFKAAMMGAGLSNMVSDHGQDDIPSANLSYYPGLPYHHLDAYWLSSPIRHVVNVKTPTLILHGDADARVHPAQGMEWYRALKSLDVPVEFVRYPREGHPIKERHHQIDLMRRLLAWYDRWLKT
ncbi:MAG: prolyl oligopeptidase family serine peptidase [Thermomicrobiales bacterium]